jgi:predicted aspartyl protease
LAESYRRSDRLSEAAALYGELGRVALAAKLEAAAGPGWYRLDAPPGSVDLPWVGETRVPVIEAMVDTPHGPRPACFVIDTGVGETLLDPAMAAEAGVDMFGEEAIHFPAGPAGRIGQGLLPRLTLAGLGVGNLPVHVHETRSSMAQLLPFPVDGVIGSGLLSRLPATLDYGRRRLQLGGDQPVDYGTAFYLASDQYPLVPARINGRLDTLLFLDTGMAGTGVALPMSTARAVNVEVLVDAEGIGYGVQNTLSATPIVCRSVSAAGIERRDLAGMLLARFRLEHQFGFRIGGLLGDGFIGKGRLRIDFAAMRVSVEE